MLCVGSRTRSTLIASTACLSGDFFRTQYAEVVGVHFITVDNPVAHALLALSDVVLQRQLIGGLVEDATVERQLDRIATVGAGDELGVPVEGQIDLLGFTGPLRSKL